MLKKHGGRERSREEVNLIGKYGLYLHNDSALYATVMHDHFKISNEIFLK